MLWVVLASFLPLTAALQWTEPLTSHTQMTSCSGSEIRLPGKYTLSPGESVQETTWTYRAANGSEETMATYSGGVFEAEPDYSDGVDWLGQAGIVIMQSPGLGTSHYSVLVTTSSADQPNVTYSRTFDVLVVDAESQSSTEGGTTC